MAKEKKPSAPPAVAAPVPLNRALAAGAVRVRARQTICEVVDGARVVIERGDEGVVAADRLAALGELVERI